MRKLVAGLACRAGGTRLYGKPLQLLDIEKRLTVIEFMIEMLRREPVIDDIVLGVSEGPENEPFHDIARRSGIHSITGDQEDVLQRLIQCGEARQATDVFRVTTESPFTYFEAIENAWRRHVERGSDVTHLTELPDGSGFEIVTLATLQLCHDRGESRHQLEHVTLYVREHQSDFRVDVIEAQGTVRRPDLRLTIDYPEDLVLHRRIYDHLRDLAPRIPLARIVEFLDSQPALRALVEPYAAPFRWYA